MSFEKIDKILDKIEALMTSSSEQLGDESASQIIDECLTVFDQLFSDDLESETIEAQLVDLRAQRTPDADLAVRKLGLEYIKRIVALIDYVDSLPDGFPAKEFLNKRLQEHCSTEWVDKYKNGLLTESSTDLDAFLAEHTQDVTQSAVEVRSWGTQEELGNGLRNVLRQKIAGDNVGHVALMMRLPVNEHNKALVEKYCLHENGASKIPYTIARHGRSLAYEIYWSYWPGRLNTPKADMEEERSGFEFTTKSGVIDELPPELRERYLFQKQKKDLFEKQQTINIAPVAVPIPVVKPYSQLQQELVNLKVRKYKTEEEIQALKTLKKNYINEGKEYCYKPGDWKEKTIKPSSNFLTIVARFKNDLPDRRLCVKILKEKKITIEQAQLLSDEIDNLLIKKTKAHEELSLEIERVSQEVYAPRIEIKNLKKEISEIRAVLTLHKRWNELYQQIEAYKSPDGKGKPSIKEFREWMDTLEIPESERLKYLNGKLTHEKIDALLLKLRTLQNKITPQDELQSKLKVANDKLDALLKSPKKETARIFDARIAANEAQIKIIGAKIEQLQGRISDIEARKQQVRLKGDNKIIELEQLIQKYEADQEEFVAPHNAKIKELEVLLVKIEAGQSRAISNADRKIAKLERLLENFDTIFANEDIANKGIRFNYQNNRPRTTKEQEMFGTSPNSWRIRNKEDAMALLEIIRADKKSLQQGRLPASVDFSYTRDKTESKIAQFGNQWYPDTGEDIWRLSSKDDIVKLISILNVDKVEAKSKFEFKPVEFSYGNTKDRPKTPEEISEYGELVYHEQGEHHWPINSREGIDRLIAIIKADQLRLQENPIVKPINFPYGTSKTRKKTDAEKAEFGSKVTKDRELNWSIKDLVHAEQMMEIMRADIRKLREDSQILTRKRTNMQLQSDEPEPRIVRGMPTRDAALHDFNVEEMLRTASKLATTTCAFDLTQENCSTTSMKLLRAGAPESMRHMFQWTKNTADNPASNAFLTNPQAVYSAATVVARAQAGDKEAIDRVKKEAFLIPNTNYYIRINKLLAYKDDKAQLLNTIKSNVFSYLRILPQLISDLWITTDTKHAPKDEQEIDKYLNKLNKAVRTQEHFVVKHGNPLLAIQHMKDLLQENPRGLPFFDEKTLKIVRGYILTIESKDEQVEEETQLLKEYASIINERDERLCCVELAVMGNKDPGAHLLSRTDKSAALTWAQAPTQQAEIMVEKFCEKYKKIQGVKYFQIFRSNFLRTLPQDASYEEKLKLIQKHILDKPTSASAQAWAHCKFKQETPDLVRSEVVVPKASEPEPHVSVLLTQSSDPVPQSGTSAQTHSFKDRYVAQQLSQKGKAGMIEEEVTVPSQRTAFDH